MATSFKMGVGAAFPKETRENSSLNFVSHSSGRMQGGSVCRLPVGYRGSLSQALAVSVILQHSFRKLGAL